MGEISRTELMNEVRRLAQEQWDRELSLEPFVRLDDGTRKSAIELTDEELYSLTLPPGMWEAFAVGRIRYQAAEMGFVYLGGGELRHIDSLTPEDLPDLRATVVTKRIEYQAYNALDDFVTETLQYLEEVGIRVDWAKPLEHLL
jgi:hypothetical protein